MAKKVESYKLNMDPKLYADLKKIADERNLPISVLMRRGIKWVLLEDELEEQGGGITVTKNEEAEPEAVLAFM